MAFFRFLNDRSGLTEVFEHNLGRYGGMVEFRDNVMLGPSALSGKERQLIAAFVSTLNHCVFCSVGHTLQRAERAAIVERLVTSIDAAPIAHRLKPIFHFVKKLTERPADVVQADAEGVFAA